MKHIAEDRIKSKEFRCYKQDTREVVYDHNETAVSLQKMSKHKLRSLSTCFISQLIKHQTDNILNLMSNFDFTRDCYPTGLSWQH